MICCWDPGCRSVRIFRQNLGQIGRFALDEPRQVSGGLDIRRDATSPDSVPGPFATVTRPGFASSCGP
jgi:hypothetical protein